MFDNAQLEGGKSGLIKFASTHRRVVNKCVNAHKVEFL
jgi:hypothetical protein